MVALITITSDPLTLSLFGKGIKYGTPPISNKRGEPHIPIKYRSDNTCHYKHCYNY